ncbi:dihydrofolate reductase family protein [Corynebacterium sp. H130]|uniref:dihydrofolate reductase family protein n=1 Tax=Corynebacterium sp. H130 TaxID=3133444 RepID=UPI0030AB8B20
MRTINAHLFSSVDGDVERPNLFQFDCFGPDEAEMMTSAMADVDTGIMGATIYREWSQYWPGVTDDFGPIINPMRKLVASTTLEEPLSWENSELIEGDLIESVRALKETDGGDITVFGISVIRQLLLAGLIDRLHLTIHPASGTNGKRLFDGIDEPVRLELIDTKVSSVGNLLATYALKTVD